MARKLLHIDGASAFVPNSVKPELRKELIEGLPEAVRVKARELVSQDWRIHVVDQDRGRCYPRERVITIPVFALKKGLSFKTWYLSHEMAHAFNPDTRDSHGQSFMRTLISICPEDSLHHELGYKPRNAAIVGITHKLNFEGL